MTPPITQPWPESLNRTRVLSLNIPGNPAPQGSLKPLGKGFKYPDSTTRHRNRVVAELLDEWQPREPLTGPVLVKVQFVFDRPKSHYLPANQTRRHPQLRGDRPIWHVMAPDSDKLCRLLGDALEIAGVLHNDSQIARWVAEKKYGDNVGTGTTFLDLYQL